MGIFKTENIMQNLSKSPTLTIVRTEDHQSGSHLKILKEEVAFWNYEATAFLEMIRSARHCCPRMEQPRLNKLELELDFWLRKVLPGYQNILNETARSVVKNTENTHLEKQQEKLRYSYQCLKRQIIPYIPKVVKSIIW